MPAIIITMAGNGERFRRAGYRIPKYMIEARDRTLFRWSLDSLGNFIDQNTEIVFLARREHDPRAFISRETASMGVKNARVVLIDEPTDGQATSALVAGRALENPAAPCIIYNIDTHVRPEALSPASVRGDGWIPCFPGEGNGWSFVAVDPMGKVSRVVEKRRISPHATIGLYWFRSFRLFSEVYHQHFWKYGSEAGERYIAPMYNTLLENGGEVFFEPLAAEAVHALGTPAEVEAFTQGWQPIN